MTLNSRFDSFGDLLRFHMNNGTGLRPGKKWTLDNLSEKACVSKDTISNWRRNIVAPRDENLALLIKAFSLNPNTEEGQKQITELTELRVKLLQNPQGTFEQRLATINETIVQPQLSLRYCYNISLANNGVLNIDELFENKRLINKLINDQPDLRQVSSGQFAHIIFPINIIETTRLNLINIFKELCAYRFTFSLTVTRHYSDGAIELSTDVFSEQTRLSMMTQHEFFIDQSSTHLLEPEWSNRLSEISLTPPYCGAGKYAYSFNPQIIYIPAFGYLYKFDNYYEHIDTILGQTYRIAPMSSSFENKFWLSGEGTKYLARQLLNQPYFERRIFLVNHQNISNEIFTILYLHKLININLSVIESSSALEQFQAVKSSLIADANISLIASAGKHAIVFFDNNDCYFCPDISSGHIVNDIRGLLTSKCHINSIEEVLNNTLSNNPLRDGIKMKANDLARRIRIISDHRQLMDESLSN